MTAQPSNCVPWPVVFVLGPTGSGKSDLALTIAAQFGGEVVNCDSLQLYRFLDIGTAKTPQNQQHGVPHHLLDVLLPDQAFSAGQYAREARSVLAGIKSRRRLPVVAGGTGFYVQALLHGLFEGPPRDEALRTQLALRDSRRPGFSHRLLRRLDPPSSKRIHPNDTQKTVRAVEVCLQARKPMSGLFGTTEKPLEGFAPLQLGLSPPRHLLYERINRRCHAMFEQGLIDEVRAILDRGYSPSAKALESIGYQQALAVLAGTSTIEQAIESTQQATRNYAKRQWTWFRRDPNIHWLEGFGNDSAVISQAVRLTSEHWASHARTENPSSPPSS